MAKPTSLETDEQTLTQKIKNKAATVEGDRNADPTLRALRKRLRRVQRKRRALQRRQPSAAPKKAGGGEAAG